MCSGRIDLAFALKAFAAGMDGVFIGACRLNECNYITHGNYHALNMAHLCKKIMARAGLNPERLRIAFMSSADGGLFTEVMNEFSRQIKELGPVGSGGEAAPEEIGPRIEEAIKLVPYIKITQRDKLAQRIGDPAKLEALYTPEEIEKLFSETVSYYIDPQKCQACMICARKCPVEAIDGGKQRIHVIDQQKCIKCGTCFEACPERFGAVTRITGEPVPAPPPEENRGVVLAAKGA